VEPTRRNRVDAVLCFLSRDSFHVAHLALFDVFEGRWSSTIHPAEMSPPFVNLRAESPITDSLHGWLEPWISDVMRSLFAYSRHAVEKISATRSGAMSHPRTASSMAYPQRHASGACTSVHAIGAYFSASARALSACRD